MSVLVHSVPTFGIPAGMRRAHSWSERNPVPAALLRLTTWTIVAVGAFGVLVLINGKNPADSFAQIWSNTLTTQYGLENVVVQAAPLILTALAVAIPARIGQVNIGGEGQLWMGGITSVGVALAFPTWSAWVLLPAMIAAGVLGGGIWSAIAGFMKQANLMSEVFSTVLMNYIAIFLAEALFFGPWRDPLSGNFPGTKQIPSAARLAHVGNTSIDVSIFVGLAALVALAWFLGHTRFGLEIRAIGGNPFAAVRNGISVSTYIVVCMFVGGAFAGFAGMAQVAGQQYALNGGLSANFGYLGFLVSWMAGHDPRLIVPMAFILAVLASSGNVLQILQGLPAGMVLVMSAVLTLIVLIGRTRRTAQ
jgi:general nucleoside transport system permease protein